MENLKLYKELKQVPDVARKKITGGRLSGMTDINPMWRIKKLTEMFGVCGFGWKYVITRQWIELGGKDEKAAFVNIDLFIKVDGIWSDAIQGTGGSSFIAAEKNGLYTSDECFKMALTDAISVACKALGMGADVYFEKDRTKYDSVHAAAPVEQKPKAAAPILTSEQEKELTGLIIKIDSIQTIQELTTIWEENKAFRLVPVFFNSVKKANIRLTPKK